MRGIVGGGNDGADIASVLERVQQTIEKNKKRGGTVGLDTGYHDLQSAQISYQPGHLWVSADGLRQVKRLGLLTRFAGFSGLIKLQVSLYFLPK